MEFNELNLALQKNFDALSSNATKLFEVDLDKDELWDLYLNSFPSGTNEIYRKRREYECSCCRRFIKNMGNVVVIKENKIHTIWGFDVNDNVFQPVLNALDKYVKEKCVTNIFVTKEKTIGTAFNYEKIGDVVYKWEHFCLALPDKFVDHSRLSEGEVKGTYRDIRNVFKRSLDEITTDSIVAVMELIEQNSLYKGEEWKAALSQFLSIKTEYELIPDDEKENYVWNKSSEVGISIGKIKNHSIGTLLINISENMDLELAVKKYEAIVAPENYKRKNAVYSKKNT